MNHSILSICIPTTNRRERLKVVLKDILKCKSSEFDIIVYDGRSTDGTYEMIKELDDVRIHYHRNESEEVTYSNQWFGALENADGTFAMHLNDRDVIFGDHLETLLGFLKNNKEYMGGVCKYYKDIDNVLCENFRESFIKIPFFSSHPTGIVIKTEYYKKIADREEIFKKSKSGSHPHDIILGRLCKYGNLFLYTGLIWQYAPKSFYKDNLSGIKYSSEKKWFFPEERLIELKICLKEIARIGKPDKEIIEAKSKQVIYTYVNLSTAGFFYFIEDEAEASHYNIKCQKISFLKKCKEIKKICKLFSDDIEVKRFCTYYEMCRYAYKILILKYFSNSLKPLKKNAIYQYLHDVFWTRKKNAGSVLR